MQVAEALASRRSVLARLARPGAAEPLRVFCSGVGGTGLSGLARLLGALGHRVRGSDRARSPRTAGLAAEGVEVVYQQRAENVGPELDLFVGTAALPPTHPELVAAIEQGVPVVKYAEALGALVEARRGIAIAGTHGKTTTTSLTATILAECGRDPSYIVGGEPKDLPANARIGRGGELVFEACEFDQSFFNYAPEIAVILNVEADHLDCYRGGLDEIVEAFVGFAARVRPGGTLIVSADWPDALRVAKAMRAARPDLRIDTFSLEGRGDFQATQLRLEGGLPRFVLSVDGEPVRELRLQVPGRHNVANALAAIVAAHRAGVPLAEAAAAAERFGGVGRRFELRARGDVVIVDDYGHHPTALRAVIAAARARYPDRRVVACFEPHQASRTRELFDEFTDALAGADRVLLADIYACRDREEDVRSVSAGELAAAVRAARPETQARHCGDLAGVERAARELLAPGDVGLFLGAGRITEVAQRLAAELGAREAAARTARRRCAAAGGSIERRVLLGLGEGVRQNVSLAPFCTFKAGGQARFFAAPESLAEAIQVGRVLGALGVPTLALGGGSNLLFASERFDGAVIWTRGLRGASVLGTTLRAAAGAGLQGLLRLAERHGLGGLASFAGIPGTVGGAVFGNAGGGPGGPSVGALARRVRVLEADGTVRWRNHAELGLRYRGSQLDGCLVLEVDLELQPADPAELRAIRQAATQRKARTQPLDARSAGCIFRNPAGASAGRVIDALGLKGLRRGAARVSDLHGNFIVNEGGASPADILGLMEEVRARVLAERGLRLESELRLIA